MSTSSPIPERDRCDDLLVQMAIYGLSPDEQKEADELVQQFEIDEEGRFEQSVGALDVALSLSESPKESAMSIPADLRKKIISESDQYLPAALNDGVASSESDDFSTVATSVRPSGWTRREMFLGLTTAASLSFGIASLSGVFNKTRKSDPTFAQKLDQLKKSGLSNLRQVTWKNPTNDAASKSASGEVIWSDEKQEGYMVFRGMEVNDPKSKQYQLWIFDTARDDALPVDGGVFDIVSTGEVIIPIDSKLAITQARMFAVTIEDPGGVVQSKRERLPLLAEISL